VGEEVDATEQAKRTGRRALRNARAQLVQRAMEQLQQRDPELVAKFTEPGFDGRNRLAAIEVLLERTVERKPSLLAQAGLSAIQALQAAADEAADEQAALRAPGTAAEVTVVFTDLEGFTEWTAAEGDESASRLLAEHHRVVEPLIRGRAGRLVKRLGDGLLLTFPTPEAAVLACLELVDTQPEPLRLRAGCHLGPVVVTADDVIGHVVNLAARVAEVAGGAEVLATRDVCAAIGDGLPNVRFSDPRPEQFKGIKSEIPVCTVSWA
jgi:adenylate cyclase